MFPADERAHRRLLACLEPALDCDRGYNPPDLHRFGQALERVGAKILMFKPTAYELLRSRADDHGVAGCKTL